jgi:hypothetical protein
MPGPILAVFTLVIKKNVTDCLGNVFENMFELVPFLIVPLLDNITKLNLIDFIEVFGQQSYDNAVLTATIETRCIIIDYYELWLYFEQLKADTLGTQINDLKLSTPEIKRKLN